MLKESIFIVNQLNKEPFLKNLSFPYFEGLSPIELIDIINEVLTEIQPNHSENIKDNNDEGRVQEIMKLLLVLEYEAIKDCCDTQTISEGLENNDKTVIIPILHWLLQNVQALKNKAYLDKFTQPVDVPMHLQHDESICAYMNQQRELIQSFHETFSVYDDARPSCQAKENALAEYKTLQQDKNNLLRRKDKVQEQLESLLQSPKRYVQAARKLRLEMEREEKLARQNTEQEEQLLQAQKRLAELESQTSGQPVQDANPTVVMRELQKDIKANTVKVTEELPAELEEMRDTVGMLRKLAEVPEVSALQLMDVKKQIQDVTSKVNNRTAEIALNQACEEERRNAMREKASVLKQQKISKAKELQQLKDWLESRDSALKASVTQADLHDEERKLRDELLNKKAALRKKCQQVAALKAKNAEQQKVQKKEERYFQALVKVVEAEKDKPGPSLAQKAVERIVAVRKGEHSPSNSAEMKKIKTAIASLKSDHSALMEEYSLVREQCHALVKMFQKKKTCRSAELTDQLTSLTAKMAELEKQVGEKKALLEVTKTKLDVAHAELKVQKRPKQLKLPSRQVIAQ